MDYVSLDKIHKENKSDKIIEKYPKIDKFIKKMLKNKIVNLFLNIDITFIFLFLSLYIFGYEIFGRIWWKLLLSSFGLWLLIKEIFKYIKSFFSKK